MKRLFLGLAVLLLLSATGCDDDNPVNDDAAPSSPTAAFGIVGDMGGSDTDIMLLWVPNTESDIEGYNVYGKTTGGLPPDEDYEKLNDALIVGDATTGCIYIDDGFNEGTTSTYYYYVTAVDEGGNESQPSAVIMCASDVYDHDNDLEVVTPPDGSDGVSAEPVFIWLTRANADSYCIILQHGAGAGNSPLWVCRGTDTSFTYGDTSGYTYVTPAYALLPDSTYRWQCFAVNEDNTAFAGLEAYFETGR